MEFMYYFIGKLALIITGLFIDIPIEELIVFFKKWKYFFMFSGIWFVWFLKVKPFLFNKKFLTDHVKAPVSAFS